MPEAGIEPARLAAPDFESSASTNFTTQALIFTLFILNLSITSTYLNMVPEAGIEPARLAATDFKSVVSTNFTTQALE